MGLFGKITEFGKGIKESISDVSEKISNTAETIEITDKINNLKNQAAAQLEKQIASSISASENISKSFGEKVQSLDINELKKKETYINQYSKYKDIGSEKIKQAFNSTFEVDRSAAEIIESLKSKLPTRPKDIDDIFEQCKKEALQRAISAFCLAPLINGFDEDLSKKYSKLSKSYTTYSNKEDGGINVRDAKNFAAKRDEARDAQRNFQLIENGYNSDESFDPRNTGEFSIHIMSSGEESIGKYDIEHIISAKEIYDDILIKIATNDDEMVDAINFEENLTFASRPLNQSKGSRDLKEYLEEYGTPDELDPDKVRVNVNGKQIEVNKKECLEKYEKAKEKVREMRIAAAKQIGLTVASASARMAAQQVVGLIIMETIDIFIEEIKDIFENGNIINEDGLPSSINKRRKNISEKLTQRFEERQIWTRARAAGIEGGVAGALGAIPQILISLIIEMPAFALTIIRECTLSVVRSTRILLSNEPNKMEAMKIIMLGTSTTIIGLYVSNAISKAIRPVPLLNTFNSQVTTVLSGLIVTAVPLGAIYAFDQNRSKITFKLLNNPQPQST